MQTIKQDKCPGLSGTNTITYEIGMENDGTYWLRLLKSSGGGFLFKGWVSMAAVIDTLGQSPSPFTSYVLHKHFAGKSINSPSFLMAVLKHEGLVNLDPIKRQAFTCDDLDMALATFQDRMSKGASKSSPPKKKRPPRKPKPK